MSIYDENKSRCLINMTLSALRGKSSILINCNCDILRPFTEEVIELGGCRHTCMLVGTPRETLRGGINQSAQTLDSRNLVRRLCVCFPFTVNTFELLNLLSKYRTAKRQTGGVLEGNSCWVRGRKCVCFVWLIIWLQYVSLKDSKRRRWIMCASVCERVIFPYLLCS